MTASELKAWVKGYVAGGGKDLKPILDAIADLEDNKPSLKPPTYRADARFGTYEG